MRDRGRTSCGAVLRTVLTAIDYSFGATMPRIADLFKMDTARETPELGGIAGIWMLVLLDCGHQRKEVVVISSSSYRALEVVGR